MGTLISWILPGFIAVAAMVWSIITIRAWAPAARKRGGRWYLEAIFLLCGPVSGLLVAMYPRDGAISGPFPAINRIVGYVVVVLAVIALINGLRRPRRQTGGLLAAVTFFYLALAFSGIAGVVPSFPEAYWVTPLIVLAFLIHGDYTLDWLLKISSFSLRAILALSFATIVALPDIAFNLEEARTVFGVHRLEGIAGHPNGLAAIAVLCFLLDLHRGSKWTWRLLPLAAIIFAQSSTAYIALAIGWMMLSSGSAKLWRGIVATSAFTLAVWTILDADGSGAFLAHVLPEQALTLTGRTTIWAAALIGFQMSPLWGYGPALLDEDYRGMYLPNFDAAAQAHNQLVQTMGGNGIVGLASLTVLALVLLVYVLRARAVTRGLTLSLLAYITIRCVTETPLKPGGVSVGTLMLVIIFGYIAIAASEHVPTVNKTPTADNADPFLGRLEDTAHGRKQDAGVQSLQVADPLPHLTV